MTLNLIDGLNPRQILIGAADAGMTGSREHDRCRRKIFQKTAATASSQPGGRAGLTNVFLEKLPSSRLVTVGPCHQECLTNSRNALSLAFRNGLDLLLELRLHAKSEARILSHPAECYHLACDFRLDFLCAGVSS